MKVTAFGASTSKNSINKALATYAANLTEAAEINILDLNDYDNPIFNEDKEKEIGKSETAQNFINEIASSDIVIISFAEHNGTYTAAYKNLFDWASRIEQKFFQNKPMIFLSTSPGPGGAKSVLNTAVTSAPFFGANLQASLSIPSFYDNFDLAKNELINVGLKSELIELINNYNLLTKKA